MKVKFNTPLRNLNGEPLTDEKEAPITLSVVAVEALLAANSTDSGAQKMTDFALAARCHNATDVELTAEEIVRIKDRIGKTMALPLIVGRCYEILEAPSVVTSGGGGNGGLATIASIGAKGAA